MTVARDDVEATINTFLVRIDKPAELTAETQLYAGGLELDSLETAELSALLEDVYGHDPFGGDEMPQTVGEIFDHYDGRLVTDS